MNCWHLEKTRDVAAAQEEHHPPALKLVAETPTRWDTRQKMILKQHKVISLSVDKYTRHLMCQSLWRRPWIHSWNSSIHSLVNHPHVCPTSSQSSIALLHRSCTTQLEEQSLKIQRQSETFSPCSVPSQKSRQGRNKKLLHLYLRWRKRGSCCTVSTRRHSAGPQDSVTHRQQLVRKLQAALTDTETLQMEVFCYVTVAVYCSVTNDSWKISFKALSLTKGEWCVLIFHNWYTIYCPEVSDMWFFPFSSSGIEQQRMLVFFL